MIADLLIALSVAAANPAAPHLSAASLSDASRAIAAGRLDQARLMVGNAIAQGAAGAEVDRLLADLAYSSGNDSEALARYRELLKAKSGDSILCERAGIAALRLGDVAAAGLLIRCAIATPSASWRAWNARGVIADLEQEWTAADKSYARAAELAPGEAQVINNKAWSLILRGDWGAAIPLLERAVAMAPGSGRIASNLELARDAAAMDLPRRRAGEPRRDWAERLNDAGVAAQAMGDRKRAIAAFSQAVAASDTWYARAANNLEAAGRP